MSTDEVTFDAPAAKPTRASAKKSTKRAKGAKKPAARAPAAAKPMAAEAFPGLTRTACATGCGAQGCVVSANIYCGHPCKGGLQASDMGNPAALKRLQAARDQIEVKVDPKRFTED